MQVSAVKDGGKDHKGKNRITGHKGRGRGKGTDKSKHKSSKSSKSKERASWNSGQQQVQLFQGYCSHCSKWRHKRADCRTRLAQQKIGAAARIQEPESEGDGVKSAQ